MIFKKPSDVTYTQMAMWIDENAYTEGVDEDKLFQYLCHLAYMLAHQSKYFYNSVDYDEFSYYLATVCMLRLKNPKQFIPDENGEYKLTKLKSILNYMKAIIYPYKVKFQKEEYKQDSFNNSDSSMSEYLFYDKLAQDPYLYAKTEFNVYLKDIPKTILSFLDKLPFDKNSVEFHSVYISCLLTFLNDITQPIHTKKFVLDNLNGGETDTILFHLNKSYSGYIRVLVNKFKNSIAEELYDLLDTKLSLENILALDYDLYEGGDYEAE